MFTSGLYVLVLFIALLLMCCYMSPTEESFVAPFTGCSPSEPEKVQVFPISKRETMLVRTKGGRYRTEMLNKECAAAKAHGFNPDAITAK